ncbi:hypothetical protein [Burkholderia ubonensis]|uniref:hypothetical protein n=1 Tax=Burkholderia ubonensis TaxID=101571 RepID=UPI001E33ACC9|nr:hypothetical protein [Burkholderia ubonensis]
MECKHAVLNASTVADNPSTRVPSVAVISSRKPRRLQARRVSIASRYSYASNNLVGIDFDIEAGQTQQVINDLVQRVVVAQQNYPNLRFSFTLATLAPSQPGAVTASSWGASAPDSFNIYGDWVMQAIQTYGLKNYTINLMTMDYGSAGPGNCVVANGTCQMGQSAIQAAMNLHDHWGVPYSQMELTPMIGGNDVAGSRLRMLTPRPRL